MDKSWNLANFLNKSVSLYYITTDRSGKLRFANDLFTSTFLPVSRDFQDIHFSSTLHAQDLSSFNIVKDQCFAEPDSGVKKELRSESRDGSIVYLEWEFFALTNNGEIAGLQALGHDITETKKEENIIPGKQLRLLLDNTEEAFIILDTDLCITIFNRSADQSVKRFFGLSLKRGSSIFDFTENSRIEHLKIIYESALNGNAHQSEARVKHNGSEYLYTNYFKPAYDSANNVAGVIITSRDVSQNRFTEEKLARERHLLRILIDHLPDYISVKDTNFRHIINNRANLDLIGAKTEDETIGKTVMDYFDKESADHILSTDKRILESGEAVDNLEESVVNRNGDRKWLLTTKLPLKEANNKMIGLVGISRDITDKKNIEENLRITIERLKIVSKATNDAIWDWDLVSGNVLWNEAVMNLFGTDSQVASNSQTWWTDHIHPADRERVTEKIYGHIRNGIESWEDQYKFECADGTFKAILDRGFILFDNDKKPFRMIGAMMDITHRKKLEDELAEQKIARQRQITEAAIMAQEKERAEIGRELHDNINQILTTTKLYIDMALNEEDIRYELMMKSHSNISTAIEEIRILSKSLVPPSLRDIGIKEAVTEMIANLTISKKIAIKLKTTGFGKVDIPGNVQLMTFRIIQEQLNNIIKHSKATEANIKLAISKESINITVMDNGVGFDMKKKTRGIGLTNIISRAEVHNGATEILSSPGNGCTLKIFIPL